MAAAGESMFSWLGNKVKNTYQKAMSSLPCKCSPEVEGLGCCERARDWLIHVENTTGHELDPDFYRREYFKLREEISKQLDDEQKL